jgi:hypothetical protein
VSLVAHQIGRFTPTTPLYSLLYLVSKVTEFVLNDFSFATLLVSTFFVLHVL